MGWIFGALGARADAPHRSPGAAPRHRVQAPGRLLVAGGPALTCRAGAFGDGAPWEGWLVAGLGLDPAAHAPVPDADWLARLRAERPRLDDLAGHFVALRHGARGVEAWTDALGLRTLHVAHAGDGVVFGTDLGEVATAAGARTLDVGALGPHWTAFNAFTARSLVRGVERLGPGGHARLTADDATLAPGEGWLPGDDAEGGEAVAERLRAWLGADVPERRLSLGLSGGLDSRLLLALSGGLALALHTFGDEVDSDVRVAHRVAAALGRPLRRVPLAVPAPEATWAALRTYASAACATTPASTVARLAHFEALDAEGLGVVDGGFGEVGRRQFFNRLRHARVPLRADAAPDLLPYLAVRRADVFAPDVRTAMRAGAAEELAAALGALPEVGREDALDLLGVRMRLPFFFGYEQARLDARAAAFMPFAQPDVLGAVFATPLALRRGGRLFRRAIRGAAPALARLPLVKSGGAYPFRLGPLGAHLYTGVRRRLAPPGEDAVRRAVLAALRDRVRGLAASDGVGGCVLYDAARVRALVDAYYGGDASSGAAVDWWLAFEAWRRTVTGEPW